MELPTDSLSIGRGSVIDTNLLGEEGLSVHIYTSFGSAQIF